MDITILYAALRTIIAFILVLILSRILGRKLISQMTFFDFVLGVSMGSVTANLALGPQNTTGGAVTVLVVFFSLTILLGLWHIKSQKVRKAANSEPVVMVANGKIVEENLGRTRITLNELLMRLREKNIFDIGDVEFALMETDGNLSVLPKSQKQPLTPSDLSLATGYKGLTKDLIMDGNVLVENLKDINLNEKWLKKQLTFQGIDSVDKVFYAGLDTFGNLYVSQKRNYGGQRQEKDGRYGIE